MKERPILFSGPMVRALLAGTKTQTRRIMARQKQHDFTDYTLFGQRGHPDDEAERRGGWAEPWKAIEHAPDWPDGKEDQCFCPYARQRGDQLWVRETFDKRAMSTQHLDHAYKATAAPLGRFGERWTPSIHMPRWASRIQLEVTEVRVQRLKDINADDAMAEGIVRLPDGGYAADHDGRHYHAASAWHSYASLWNAINGAGSWDLNPWVWAVSFSRIKP